MSNAIVIRENGNPSVMRYESVLVGEPGPREVLIRHEAIGVNAFDALIRSGRIPAPLPMVLGVEAAGVIERTGSDTVPFKVGDRVGYFYAEGAYADYNIVDASDLIALPDDISSVHAAAFLAKGLTAWMSLRALHHLKADESILIQGASGNVGSLVTRWAMNLGASVIGVAGSEKNLASVARAASLALLSTDTAILEKLHTFRPNGVDVVYDFVGNATFPLSMAAVRDGGKILTIGAASGQPRPDHVELARRSIEMRGGGTPQYVNASTKNAASSELFDLIRRGIFADIQLTQSPLRDAKKVHLQMDARRLDGVHVLIP